MTMTITELKKKYMEKATEISNRLDPEYKDYYLHKIRTQKFESGFIGSIFTNMQLSNWNEMLEVEVVWNRSYDFDNGRELNTALFQNMVDYWREYAVLKNRKGVVYYGVEKLPRPAQEFFQSVAKTESNEAVNTYMDLRYKQQGLVYCGGEFTEEIKKQAEHFWEAIQSINSLIDSNPLIIEKEHNKRLNLIYSHLALTYCGMNFILLLSEPHTTFTIRFPYQSQKPDIQCGISFDEFKAAFENLKEENRLKNLLDFPKERFSYLIKEFFGYDSKAGLSEAFNVLVKHTGSWEQAELLSMELFQLRFQRKGTIDSEDKFNPYILKGCRIQKDEHWFHFFMQKDIETEKQIQFHVFISEEERPKEVRDFVGSVLLQAF